MSGAQSISTRRAYGVQRVCRVWHRARSSVYARRQATRSPALCRRRGPIGAAPDDVLVAHLRRVLEASPFHGEGYRKAWAKLRVAGMRTSKERVRRLMREHDLQAPPRAGHAHGPKAHDGTITTEAPDVMWGTDMTATVTVAEGAAFVFVAVDHCATTCIGLPAVQVLGIEHVDPRTDDLVPLDRRDVVVEEVDPVTADHGDALELTVRFERREFPDGRPGTGGIVHRGSRKLIQQRADSLGHFRPRSPLDAVDGDDLERRGIAAHDGGDGVVALLGPVDADAVPRPGRIRPGPLGGGTRLAAPDVFEIAR